MPDALHPNVAGMELLAQCMQAFTDQYLSSWFSLDSWQQHPVYISCHDIYISADFLLSDFGTLSQQHCTSLSAQLPLHCSVIIGQPAKQCLYFIAMKVINPHCFHYSNSCSRSGMLFGSIVQAGVMQCLSIFLTSNHLEITYFGYRCIFAGGLLSRSAQSSSVVCKYRAHCKVSPGICPMSLAFQSTDFRKLQRSVWSW